MLKYLQHRRSYPLPAQEIHTYNDNRVVADHPVSEDCHVACNLSSLLLVNPDNDKMTPS